MSQNGEQITTLSSPPPIDTFLTKDIALTFNWTNNPNYENFYISIFSKTDYIVSDRIITKSIPASNLSCIITGQFDTGTYYWRLSSSSNPIEDDGLSEVFFASLSMLLVSLPSAFKYHSIINYSVPI